MSDEGCVTGCYWDGGVCSLCGARLRCSACGQFVTIEKLDQHLTVDCQPLQRLAVVNTDRYGKWVIDLAEPNSTPYVAKPRKRR